jgi:hypothetical protein
VNEKHTSGAAVAVLLVLTLMVTCAICGLPAMLIAAISERNAGCLPGGEGEVPSIEELVTDFDIGELPSELRPYNARQLGHAVTVVRTGVQMNIPVRGYIVALATVSQESTFRNLANSNVAESMRLPHEGVGSDHDSVGLFQQRAGWGSVQDRMTPTYAARKFYEALQRVDGWEAMEITVAAQEVQSSGHPTYYADDEPVARAMVALILDNPELADAVGDTGRTACDIHGLTPPREFGAEIDDYQPYDGQSTCAPTERPGVQDFRDMLVTEFPHTADWGISRECSAGGTSEHKEGRALDWRVDVNTERETADSLIGWLLATDEFGNKHAMARRLGVMYIIWDRQIWGSYNADAGFRPYSCSGVTACHQDHVHFSFGWPGARQQTSWWTGQPWRR